MTAEYRAKPGLRGDIHSVRLISVPILPGNRRKDLDMGQEKEWMKEASEIDMKSIPCNFRYLHNIPVLPLFWSTVISVKRKCQARVLPS